jgi:hypothetical protein
VKRIVLAGVASAGLLVPLPAHAQAPTVIHLWEKGGKFTLYHDGKKVKDPDAHKPDNHDSFVGLSKQYRGSHTKHGKKVVANGKVECKIVNAKKFVGLCDGTLTFKKDGSTLFTRDAKLKLAKNPTVFPITGGTGRYAHVTSGTISDFTYDLQADADDMTIRIP